MYGGSNQRVNLHQVSLVQIPTADPRPKVVANTAANLEQSRQGDNNIGFTKTKRKRRYGRNLPPQVSDRIEIMSSDRQKPGEHPRNGPKSALKQEKIPENFRFISLPRYIHMNTGATIYLDTFSKKCYHPGLTNCDRELLANPKVWHQFVVHHNGKFNKKEILKSLFAYLGKNEFFPIAYREYTLHDVFLLTSDDKDAIDLLFKNHLKVRIRDTELKISVQLGAGQIQPGQVHPKIQITLACQELLKIARSNAGVINLDRFDRNSAFLEVPFTFTSDVHLLAVFEILFKHEKIIRGIQFTNCEIEKLESFRFLSQLTKLEYIDLRNNKIEAVIELKHLEKLNLTRLDVAGNIFTEEEERTQLQERIKKLLPTLKILDGMELLIRPKLEPGLPYKEDLDFDMMLDGEKITIKDDLNAIQANFRHRYKASNYWHKVTVFHEGRYTCKQIVSMLLALADNTDLWPCYYSSFPQYDEFFVHNNYDALEILIRNNLFIKTANLEIMLTMNITPYKIGHVDIVEKIRIECVESLQNKVLNFSNLANREIFKNVIIDLSSSRVVSQIILWASRKVSATTTAILLNNNGIVSCAGMYPLTWFTKLEVLNLRNNNLETFERLSGISLSSKVTSVYLEGNPLCNCPLQTYVKNVKGYFSDVKVLDGANVNGEILMLGRQNYLSKPESYSFVESFVKHYFNIYDSNQQQMLKEIYLNNAMFTLSTNFDPNRFKEITRMSKYTSNARNIMKLVNLDQSTRNVFVGPETIVQTIIDLHKTEHNFMSFCIDVPIYTKTFCLITIDGVFKDKPVQFLDDEFLVHFTRTFTLKSCGSGMGVSGLAHQYKIQNDMLNVRNVSTNEKLSVHDDVPMRNEEIKEDMTDSEMDNLIMVFQQLTYLNRNWANRFLREANWNFKVALKLCVKLLEDDKIPEDGFMKS